VQWNSHLHFRHIVILLLLIGWCLKLFEPCTFITWGLLLRVCCLTVWTLFLLLSGLDSNVHLWCSYFCICTFAEDEQIWNILLDSSNHFEKSTWIKLNVSLGTEILSNCYSQNKICTSSAIDGEPSSSGQVSKSGLNSSSMQKLWITTDNISIIVWYSRTWYLNSVHTSNTSICIRN